MTVRTRCSRTTLYRDRTRELAERRQGSRRTLAKGHRRPCLGGCGWHLCLRWLGRRGATALCRTSLGAPLLALPQVGADEALDSDALSFLLNHALEENEKEEEKERRKREEELRKKEDVPVSVEWVQLLDDKGKTHCWNRRTCTTVWKPVEVVWVGRRMRVGVPLLAQGFPCQCVRPPSSSSRVKEPPPAQGGKQILGAAPVPRSRCRSGARRFTFL